ncbi:hypothetical protein [Streptomyces purpureus]|uniref:hypothetical protein n=1 Tax=Streptomyces purpureus TaxID=1951 RepID=UPI0003804EF6|nr:hypothetical protein [Streptomyces purpureus]
MTTVAPHPPLLKTAFEHPPTAAALRRHVRRRRVGFYGSIAVTLFMVFGLPAFVDADTAVRWAVPTVLAEPLVALLPGLALVSSTRAARVLRHYPWRAYPCTHVPVQEHRDHLVVLDLGGGKRVAVHPVPLRCDLERKKNRHPGVIWFAGDVHSGGVASPVGGHYPMRVVRASLGRGGGQDGTLPPATPLAERAGLAKGGRYRRLSL